MQSLCLVVFTLVLGTQEVPVLRPYTGDRSPTARTAVAPASAGMLPAPLGMDAPGPLSPLPGEVHVQDIDPGRAVPAAPAGRPHAPRGNGVEGGFLWFVGGEEHPPAGERLDPALASAARAMPDDGRGSARTYAYAVLAERYGEGVLDALRAAGAEVLGYHPWNTVKLSLPVASLDAVAWLPEVRWLGVPRPELKLHPRLAQALADSDGSELELWIDLYESDLCADSREEWIGLPTEIDPGGVVREAGPTGTPLRIVHSRGWQERALRELGVRPIEYSETLRAFRAHAPRAAVERLLELDFVAFLEPSEPAQPAHNDSMPGVNTDFVRYYHTGGTYQSAVAGLIDSGFDAAHADLDHVFAAGWELGGMGGAWNDPCGHGSHVAGTLLGSGGTDPEFRGSAPTLGSSAALRFFNIKTSNTCTNWLFSLSGALDALHTNYFDGAATTPYPHVVNNSWGTLGTAWIGSEADCRLFDDAVYQWGQMHVFAAGNEGPGPGTVRLQAVSKNVLTVGNVESRVVGSALPGSIWPSSSRGPTGDFRWKPSLSAPGVLIDSVDAGTGTLHIANTGTSMAAPHVAGAAALMIDWIPFMRYRPEVTAAILMATSLAKDGAVLANENDPHFDSYGTGRLDTFRSNFGSAQNPVYYWGYGLGTNQWASGDLTILSGCKRMVVCMNYVEPPASAGAGQALVNDLQLYVDAPPLDPNMNVGDYTIQQSVRDNTEFLVIENPIPGTWRWKVWPFSTPSPSYLGVSVALTYGDTTPNLGLSLSAADEFLRVGDPLVVNALVSNTDYVATQVALEPLSGQTWTVSKLLADVILADAYQRGLPDLPVTLGNVPASGARLTTLSSFAWQEGFQSVTAEVRGENAAPVQDTVWVVVDSTPPNPVEDLTNPDHTPGIWSSAAGTTSFSWTGGHDALSGVAGYSWILSENVQLEPDAIVDGAQPSASIQIHSAVGNQYFTVSSVDLCGNVGLGVTYGPILVDAVAPETPHSFYTYTHQVGVTSCNPGLYGSWEGGDAHSGVAGWAAVWDEAPDTDPGTSATLLSPELVVEFPLVAATEVWLHVRAIDAVGNVSPVVHHGPFPLVPYDGSVAYCSAKTSGLGCTPTIATSGAPVAVGGPLGGFHVTATGVDGDASGWLVWGDASLPATWTPGLPFLGGKTPNGVSLCVTPVGAIGGLSSGGTPGQCDGVLDVAFDWIWFSSHGYSAGSEIFAQFVYTDPVSLDGSGFGHSDAVTFTLCP